MAGDRPASGERRPPETGPGGAPASDGAPGSRPWQLRRSVADRKVKGVAGGVAVAADVDPTLVRLLFAVAALSGWGIVAYIVLAVVLQDETVEDRARPLPHDQRRILRIGLVVAAAVAAGRFLDGWFFDGGIGLPFLLIAVGAAVLWARREQRPGPAVPPSAPAAPTEGWTGAEIPAAPWPVAPPAPPLGAGIDWRSTGHDLLRLAAAFVAVGAFLALLGGAFLVIVGAVPMRLPFLPAAVGVAGLLGLVVAVVRRVRPAGLLFSGGVLVVAAALAVGLASFPGGAGNRVVVIGPGTPLLDHYEQSAGRLLLDLGQLSIEPATTRRVVARVGSGQLTVIVPPALATQVKARVGAGSAVLFGREQSGPGVRVTGSHAGDEGAGRLDLDLDVGVGQVTVELPTEPTFKVACIVPDEVKGDGSDEVSCPHPRALADRPMACAVALADPDGGPAGQAFCRMGGNVVSSIGRFAAKCIVPKNDDRATCAALSRELQIELEGLSSSRTPDDPPPVGSPGPGPAPLTCGPPDPAGLRTCTTAPASSTSTTATTAAPVQLRCTEDATTKLLSCVPA